MKRLIVQLSILVIAFLAGTLTSISWNRYFSLRTAKAQQIEEQPLTITNVSRSLTTRSFFTQEIEKNRDEDIVWRWLSRALAAYPQNTLNPSDKPGFVVKLYKPIMLDDMEFNWYNDKLQREGLSPLRKNNRYLPINVFSAPTHCQVWGGLIDLEEMKLAYFGDRPLLVTQYATGNRPPCLQSTE